LDNVVGFISNIAKAHGKNGDMFEFVDRQAFVLKNQTTLFLYTLFLGNVPQGCLGTPWWSMLNVSNGMVRISGTL
jgi:hypothetical protein